MSTKTSKTSKTKSTKPETRAFQAETKQLLDLMIHSLYTNKEIFLRELISNSSDAIDKVRFEALTHPDLLTEDEAFEIRIEADSDARILTIHDNGIGMSRDEVINNIGTIAKSGSRELMETMKQNPTDDQLGELIGQFGVGFYAAFMVADQVTVVTRRAGEETATRWQSFGDGEYTLSEGKREGRGTSITLNLKEVDKEAGLDDFTDPYVIQRIVKQYSDFVAYPIVTKEERQEPELDDDGKPIEGKSTTVIEDKTLNSMTPIWTRPESEVEDSEYAEFYRHISHDWTEPLDVLRFKAEGRIEYRSLLFVPGQAPFDLYYYAYEYGLQLYVRRVMIMDRCEDLLPRYLRFIKGIVDSSDLPLNISRQRLQEDRHITQMRKWLTKKILDSLAELKKKDEEKYLKFWQHFGKAMKEGLASDFDNKDKLISLVLFESSHDAEKLTTLEEYVGRMAEDQEDIYYLTGESRKAIDNSPHLEAFKAKGVEVLYLTDPVDELVVQHLSDFQDKKLKSVGKGTVELGSKEEKEEKEKQVQARQEEVKDLLAALEKTLEENVKQVRLSTRLTTSPACLVGAEHDYSPQLEKLLQQSEAGGQARQRRILELNPDHAILKKLQERFDANPGDPLINDYGELLMGYALLAEGTELPDPVRFNRLMADVMVAHLQDAPIPPVTETPAEETPAEEAPKAVAEDAASDDAADSADDSK